MPFQNVSGDDATDYLSDGLSETLINTLSRLPGLKVIAQSSALRYKGKQIDPQEVGRQLDVQTLLMGRVAQRGADLVVNVELVDARDRTQIWGEQYSRKLNDILFVQSAVVQEVAARLRLQPGERGKAATGSPDAYQLYLKGRYFCAQWSPEGLQKGVQYFKQAIAVDPGYALAYDGLAYCYAVTDWWEPWRIASERARAFAKRALELDGSLSEAHTSLGIIATWLDYDWAAAESEFKQAIALNPNSAAAHQWYGFLLLVVGRIEESIAQAKRAISLDPLSPETNSALGVYLFYAHRYDEALPPLRTAIELAPAYWFAHLYLARVQEQKGDLAGAVAGLEKAALMEGAAPEVTAALGYAYAAAGRRGDADKAIATLNQQSRQRYVPAYSYATVYAGLGDKDRAFAWLEKEMREGAYYAAFLGVDPEMDSLRPDPRFASLVRRLGVGPR
jgi:TolB-like protein/Flp pilus assembly protein TadD